MIGHDVRGDAFHLEKKKYAFSTKNNASKEIESWGKDYESMTGSMRSAGQLTDNVTEARLLQNRIMEMSRDRYKYITQADFNKKFFLDTQQRKTRLMPQLLNNIDIDYWMSKKTTRHVPQFSNPSSSNARFAFLDRLEKQGEKCKDFEEEEDGNPFAYPSKPKPPEKQDIPEFYRIRLKEQEEADLAKTTFPTQPVTRPMTQKAVAFCSENKLPEVAQSVKSMPVSRGPRPSTSERKAHLLRRAQTSGPSRSVKDPRYMTLEKSLSAQFSRPEAFDPKRVQSIIQAQDSLHIPSKAATTSRPKLQKTILEYLRARGFDV